MKETPVSKLVQLELSHFGSIPMRNNVGVAVDETGRHIRYGLMNESPTVNKRIKSSDIIAITPLVITPAWIGHRVGVFTAIETKASGWKFSQADERAVAQAAFHAIVREAGGFAGFATGPQDVARILGIVG